MKAIDLFAGAGGFTIGAIAAGLDVVWAANHWPEAVAIHARNHPDAQHLCQDLHQAGWSAIDKPGRAAATLRRIARGRAEHGDRFLTSYYGATTGGRSLSRPVGTITTRDRWAIIDGDRMRMFSVAECRRAMGFPDSYQLPTRQKDAVHMLGNAVVPPVVTDILRAIKSAV